MATFKFGSTNSLFNSSGDAFAGDSSGPDTLIVADGGYLITTSFFSAAFLNPSGAWTVFVNGTMLSYGGFGISLDSGNPGLSQITVGANGSIGGLFNGINAASPAIIKNSGVIAGVGGQGISLSGSGIHSITNSGIIRGADLSIVDLDGLSNDTVTNSGTLNGRVSLGGGNDALVNFSTILTTGGTMVDLGEGNNKFINSGTTAFHASPVFSAGAGNDTISNSGMLRGTFVHLGDGNNKVTNSGTLECSTVTGGIGNDTVVNNKTITGDLNLGDGNNIVTNSGVIGLEVILGAPVITCGNGNDAISNSGKIARGIALGGGDDTLINSGVMNSASSTPVGFNGGSGNDMVTNTGTIIGVINLGDGNDKLFGSVNPEIVSDGNGSDIINLAGGNDLYQTLALAADGTDIISGGGGIDSYSVGTNTFAQINLDIVAHDQGPFNPGAGIVAANTTILGGSGIDKISGFEDASGSIGDDIIYGNAVANKIFGDLGGDILNGYGGNDTLNGGGGDDTLFGGAGRDMLSGGSGNDRFQFAKVSDSGVTKATRDVITDFAFGALGFDIINLSAIDANTKTAGDQAFDYINDNSDLTPAANFTMTAGELRSIRTFDGYILEGDVNGDGNADFAIELLDPNHNRSVITDAVFFL